MATALPEIDDIVESDTPSTGGARPRRRNTTKNTRGTVRPPIEGEVQASVEAPPETVAGGAVPWERRFADLDTLALATNEMCQRLSAASLASDRAIQHNARTLDTQDQEIQRLDREGRVRSNQVEEVRGIQARAGEILDRHTTMLGLLQRTDVELRDDIRQVRTDASRMIERRVREVGGRSMPSIRLELPTFSAAPYDRPTKFLRDLENYVRGMHILDDEIKYIIGQALRGTAADWWDFVCDSVHSLNEFKIRFNDKYWNANVQRQIRRELEWGFYNADKNFSMAEYVLALHNRVKYISLVPPEEEIVEMFSRHFDETIQQAIMLHGTRTIDDLLKLLDSYESMGVLNSSLEEASRTAQRQRATPTPTRVMPRTQAYTPPHTDNKQYNSPTQPRAASNNSTNNGPHRDRTTSTNWRTPNERPQINEIEIGTESSEN